MTSRPAADPSVTDFEATVERVDDREVVLDETYFYPEGGGQPADRGSIGGVAVTDVQSEGDAVVHSLAAEPPFEAGETVTASVDDDFRTYCMRAHTASHLLYGAGRRVLEDLGYGGFGIGESKVRVDFTTSTEIDDERLVELERLVNQAIWDSRSVSWERLPREEALAREDVAFNTRTEEGITGETVRVVTVADWDVAACGGTHVSNTREIGPVTVLDRSNPGEGLTRVEFAVGPDAIEHRASDHENARTAARALDTRIDELPDAVDRLREERDALEREVDALREQVVEARLSDLREAVVERDGRDWLVGDLPGLDANDLADVARSMAGTAADVVVLVGEDGSYLAAASACDLDAGDVVGRATDAFGGGGGGSPSVAQAGGLDASAEEVTALYEGD
jgi:alanyl-tRNA synthetase